MSDIASWLESVGLGRHVELFYEAEIDIELLAHLTDDDIEALGLPIGAKRRLRMALEALESPPVEGDGLPALSPAAERRQLSIMFCDLVGSVALGEEMELEDYRELLAGVRGAMAGAVDSHHGFVARHQGDGLLAYFGYPQAREDDAERAVAAALAAIDAVTDSAQRMQVRVGIATGPAIVGDVLATGASAQSELAALGTTPNLAARLQSHAQPGEVLVSDTTYALTERLFRSEPVDIALKGIDGNVIAYRVTGRREARDRLDITSGRRLTPLVGREEELALLAKRWRQACDGTGQVALVSAEPGVGKTRMMMEAYGRFGDDAAASIVWFCAPYHTDSALHPVTDFLARTLVVEGAEPTDDRVEGLERWLESLSLDPERLVPLLAPLMSLEVPARYGAGVPDGPERRRRTLAALVDVVLAHAARGPALLAVEDLHWIDPTTSELLGLIVDAIRERPLLVLLTFRPEFVPPWGSQAHLTTLTLNHLTGGQCRELVRGIEAGAELPDDIVAQMIERTDGIPLFLEELAKTVLEAGAGGERTIPATLRDALTARLDRLGEAKALAQLASVVGRVFPLWLLRAAAPERISRITEDLERLVSSGLVYRRTLTGTEHYAFKHALVRDSAYQSLIRDERQALHTAVAAALVAADDPAAAPDELVARHFTDAGDTDHALHYWLRAGEGAQSKGAYEEALAHFDAALVLLSAEQGATEQSVRVSLGRATCLHFLGRRAEALAALEPLRANVDLIEDRHLVGRFHVFLARVQAFHGQREASLENVRRAIDVANACGDTVTEGNAYAWLGRDRMLVGDLDDALRFYERGAELLRTAGPSWDLGDLYFRMGMWARTRCDVERLQAVSQDMHAVAEELQDHRLRCNAILIEGIAWRYRGDLSRGEKRLRYAEEVAPDPYERVFCRMYLALHFLHTGRPSEALDLLSPNALGQFRSQQVRSICEAWTAWGHAQLGRADEAISHATRALSVSDELGGVPDTEFQAPYALALAAFANGDTPGAVAWMQKAIDTADRIGMRGESIEGRLGIAPLFAAAGRTGDVERVLDETNQLAVALGAEWYEVRARERFAEFGWIGRV